MNSPKPMDVVLERTGDGTRVSVIVPARNEAKIIGKCLDSLVRLKFPRGDWEVIVVDNGSTDETVPIAAAYRERLDLRVTSKVGFISAVRNHAAVMAKGTVFAFLDADCEVPETWLSDAVTLCSTTCVTGSFYGIPPRSSWVARAWYGYEQQEKSGLVSYIPSGDLIMYRETFLKVGGFDETIETNEDYEFCQRALKTGFQVIAFPKLAVTHWGTPQTVAGFYKKQRWHGRHVITVTLRDMTTFSNARAVSFAVYTLVCMTGILSGIFLGLGSGRYQWLAWWVLALLLAPVALSARLSIRRRNLRDLVPLTLLFLTYGVARARCLLDVGEIFKSRPKKLAP